jgi:hypothetical protein
LLVAGIVATAVYGPPLTRYLSAGGAQGAAPSPTLRLSLSTSAYEIGQAVIGEITITSTTATTLRELAVVIYPVGTRRGGAGDDAVRARALQIPVPSVPAGLSTSYRFVWDQRRDDGTLAPRGDYVLTARLNSQTDQGNSHAATTSSPMR